MQEESFMATVATAVPTTEPTLGFTTLEQRDGAR